MLNDNKMLQEISTPREESNTIILLFCSYDF